MRSHALFLVAVVACVFYTPARAVNLTFTYTGNGRGTLNGVDFPASDFVITATADTVNRTHSSSVWWLPNTSASIQIAGLGNVGILVPTQEFVNNSSEIAGFAYGPSPGGRDLLWGPDNAAFATWDLSGPIGPITGAGLLLQWGGSDPPVNTTGGILTFANHWNPITYTVTPEPAAISLVALAGLLAARVRR
jgi:hypothetical protein